MKHYSKPVISEKQSIHCEAVYAYGSGEDNNTNTTTCPKDNKQYTASGDCKKYHCEFYDFSQVTGGKNHNCKASY